MVTAVRAVDRDCCASRLSARPTPGALEMLVADGELKLRVVLIKSRVKRATATRLNMVAIMENPASCSSFPTGSARRLVAPARGATGGSTAAGSDRVDGRTGLGPLRQASVDPVSTDLASSSRIRDLRGPDQEPSGHRYTLPVDRVFRFAGPLSGRRYPG